MARVHSGEEILPKGSTPLVGCTNVTDDRRLQTDDRQTDRRICDSKDPNVTQSRSGKNAYAGLGCTQRVGEWNSFVLRRHHTGDIFLRSKVELGNSLETLLQMWLDTKWVLCLRQNFQQLVIREKKESKTPKIYSIWSICQLYDMFTK